MKNMSMSMKIYSVLAVMALVAVIVFLVGLNKLSGMNERINSIVDVSAEKVKLGARINQDLLTVSRAEKNIILAKTQEEMDTYGGFIDATRQEMQERREQLRDLADEAGKAKLDQFAATWDQYLETNKEVRDLARLNSNVKARELSSGKGREAFDKLEQGLGNIAAANEAEFDRAARDRNVVQLVAAGAKVKLSARLLRNAVEYHRAEKNLILARNQQEMDAYATALENIEKDITARFSELEGLVDETGRQDLAKAKEAFVAFDTINHAYPIKTGRMLV